MVAVDSALLHTTMPKLIALFNEHTPHPKCLYEFYTMGLIKKFADDLYDLLDNIAAVSPNQI
jgi:hypothetical protein